MRSFGLGQLQMEVVMLLLCGCTCLASLDTDVQCLHDSHAHLDKREDITCCLFLVQSFL